MKATVVLLVTVVLAGCAGEDGAGTRADDGGREAAAALGAAVGATVGGSAGQHYAIHVRFDPATFSVADVRDISTCRLTVTGADSASVTIGNCQSAAAAESLDGGVLDFTSAATPGTMYNPFTGGNDFPKSLIFRLRSYAGQEHPTCQTGDGTTQLTIPGPNAGAAALMADLVVTKTGSGCSP